MAQLLVSAAVNVGLGLLLNFLFPPPDIVQEGPRLRDRDFTSAAHGAFVQIIFGTDRVAGVVIDAPDPAIEEVVTEETEGGGKGGGQSVTTRTYSYFATLDIAFCIQGASDLIRLWADGKLVYDARGGSSFKRAGVNLTFYPGGPDQSQDPEEVSRHGASDTPAYRHLTRVKLDRFPLADYGNRIPNFTAEIAFESQASNPFITITEPTGLNMPNADARLVIDEGRNRVYHVADNDDAVWSASLSDLTFLGFAEESGGLADPIAGIDGFYYDQDGATNFEALNKIDAESGEVVKTSGGTFVNGGIWYQLSVSQPGLGVKGFLGLFKEGTFERVQIVDADSLTLVEDITTELINYTGGTLIPDHDKGRFYVFVGNATVNQLVQVEFLLSVGFGGAVTASLTVTELRQFTKGSAGSDFESSNDPSGWAVDRANGRLVLSNGANTILYDPETDVVLASRQDIGFTSEHNYFSGNVLGIGNDGTQLGGEFTVLDTRTLETVRTVDATTIGWPGGAGGAYQKNAVVWDDRTQAVVVSRSTSGVTGNQRLVKVFLNRVSGQGVGLDTVVRALSTEYQLLPMAGLTDADIDVSELTGDTVKGYTINNQGTIRDALGPLRKRFLFDGVESDWIMKFPKRGRAAVLTIPEEDVGELRRSPTQRDDPPVKDIRTQEVELPMRVSVRYRNKDVDYDPDVEHSKRHQNPVPTMRSRNELTLDLALVDTPEPIKRTAESILFSAWAERRQFQTIIPWSYLKLDPTDVFNMGVAGETFVLRMAKEDVGVGFSMDITGVVEDIKNYSSTVAAGSALNHVTTSVPSDLPTRLVFLDAPLLNPADLRVNSDVSAAYIAFGAFEDGWPGGSAHRSRDDVSYLSVATGNAEAAVARVKTAPGAWSGEDNRFQEVSEGGTMTITPLRRQSAWASAADETTVLNGANAIAVITSNGVEVIQFQDVTVNDDNTIDLERLLRGRLGTEDVVDAGGPSVGDEVVLLTDSTGISETRPISKTNLGLSLLDTDLFYRGVTIGSGIEDAARQSFTYTGRDLRPYSVAHLSVTVEPDDDLFVEWVRRTRGAGLGEWLDGTGEVPLNETIERYEVTVRENGSVIHAVTVDDATSTTIDSSVAGTPVRPNISVEVVQVSGNGISKSPLPDFATFDVT